MKHRHPRLAPVALAWLCLFALLTVSVWGCGSPDDCAKSSAASPAYAAIINGAQAIVGAVVPRQYGLDPICGGTKSPTPVVVNPFSGEDALPINSCLKGGPAPTDCKSCVKSRCCPEASAALMDTTAICLVGCQNPEADPTGQTDCGGTDLAAATMTCGAGPDATYDALDGCVADHCADLCKTLRLQ